MFITECEQGFLVRYSGSWRGVTRGTDTDSHPSEGWVKRSEVRDSEVLPDHEEGACTSQEGSRLLLWTPGRLRRDFICRTRRSKLRQDSPEVVGRGGGIHLRTDEIRRSSVPGILTVEVRPVLAAEDSYQRRVTTKWDSNVIRVSELRKV